MSLSPAQFAAADHCGKIFDRIDELAALAPGWDSYDAAAIIPDAIDEMRMVATALCAALAGSPWAYFLPALDIVPRSSGGLQIEAHAGGIDVEASVDPDRVWEVFATRGEAVIGDTSDLSRPAGLAALLDAIVRAERRP